MLILEIADDYFILAQKHSTHVKPCIFLFKASMDSLKSLIGCLIAEWNFPD
jgi:hypothetical protein